MTVNYEDKYGALGKIAVLLGKIQGRSATIHCWVMSCRAFSRRVEQQCLNWLFDNFELEELRFDYQQTDRNKPLQDFFSSIIAAPLPSDLRISRHTFFEKCPPLFHEAKATVNG
jgi:predicted enzyme involved in methoxymalonyl-ACP biosynthesis